LLKGFGNILVKELKELIRDPKILLGMIIVPLVMFPVLGAVMNFSMQSVQEQAQKATILVMNNDGGDYSQIFITALNSSVRVFMSNYTSPEDAVNQNELPQYNTTQLVEIPPGFSANMTLHVNGNQNITASVKIYSVFSSSGVFENVGSSIIDNLIGGFNRQLAPNIIQAEKSSIIKGQIKEGVDPAQLSALMISQTIAMPITIMILLTYSMQIAATSVAMEKEEKTLETLLTLPVDRFSILMGKLSGSILVAGVAAVAYMLGFNYYMGSFASTFQAGTSLDLVSLGLAPSLFGYTLLATSIHSCSFRP
jgi:ABC-2 type transport system permease protein